MSALFLFVCAWPLSPRDFLSDDPELGFGVTALPKIELFTELQSLITSYPSPPSLRNALLDYTLDILRVTLPDEPLAIKLFATRTLKPDLEGADLIDALKTANENLLADIQNGGKNTEKFLRVYADFAQDWCRVGIDENLVGLHLLIECYVMNMTLIDRWCFSEFILSHPCSIWPTDKAHHRHYILRICGY